MRTSRLPVIAIALALAPAATAQTNAFHDPRVQAQLEALKQEPSIQETQRAALEFFRIDPDTVGSMRSRASWKSVLPAVKVAGRTNVSDVKERRFNIETFSETEPAALDYVDGDVLELVVEGTWDLPRLVFNPEVLDVSSLVVLQESVLKEITRLYYTRRRLQVDLILNPPTDPSTRLSKELRIEELTSTLDAMTGNLFTKHARRQARLQQRRQQVRGSYPQR